MSIVNRNRVKIVVRADGVDFFSQLQEHWAGTSRLKWKSLAVVHLYCHMGWTLERIGLAFGHPKGHVSRIVRATVARLKDHFEVSLNDPERILGQEDEPIAA